MKTKSKVKVKTAPLNDMLFTFKYAIPEVLTDANTFSEADSSKLQEAVKYASREICIDKTYVEFTGTKYDKTFITEDGWKSLCNVLDITNFGKVVDKQLNEAIQESYREMIVQYLYLFMSDLGYDTSKVIIDMPATSKFMTIV